jgi:hypothetical protein
MATSIVSAVIPAYNPMPYLTRCISSVAEQSIGGDHHPAVGTVGRTTSLTDMRV